MLILVIITVILCVIFAALIYRAHAPETYIESHIELPAKIDYIKPEQKKYGVGGVLMNIVSIGGHARLRDAIHRYEDSYDLYALEFNDFVDHYATLIDNLNALGKKTKQSMAVLRHCQQLLEIPIEFQMSSQYVHQFDETLYQITRYATGVDSSESSGVVLLQGSTIGGLAAVGSWSLVTMLGSTSTGAAISGLYGAAATNATLAWFGGGALAAGGGGVAAGAMTLGAIVAAPLVAFTVYKTHSKASEVEEQILDIEDQRILTRANDQRINSALTLCSAQLQQLSHAYERLNYVETTVRKQLYPHGIWSMLSRKLQRLIGKVHLSAIEVQALERLNQEVSVFCSAFSPPVAAATQPLAQAQLSNETSIVEFKPTDEPQGDTAQIDLEQEEVAALELESAVDDPEPPPLSAPAPVDLTKHAAVAAPQPPAPPANAPD